MFTKKELEVLQGFLESRIDIYTRKIMAIEHRATQSGLQRASLLRTHGKRYFKNKTDLRNLKSKRNITLKILAKIQAKLREVAHEVV